MARKRRPEGVGALFSKPARSSADRRSCERIVLRSRTFRRSVLPGDPADGHGAKHGPTARAVPFAHFARGVQTGYRLQGHVSLAGACQLEASPFVLILTPPMVIDVLTVTGAA